MSIADKLTEGLEGLEARVVLSEIVQEGVLALLGAVEKDVRNLRADLDVDYEKDPEGYADSILSNYGYVERPDTEQVTPRTEELDGKGALLTKGEGTFTVIPPESYEPTSDRDAIDALIVYSEATGHRLRLKYNGSTVRTVTVVEDEAITGSVFVYQIAADGRQAGIRRFTKAHINDVALVKP